MKSNYFPVKTFLDLESFKVNKKFENIENLIEYLSSEYRVIMNNSTSILEVKYAHIVYKNVLIYNNINMLKKKIDELQINLAFEKDLILKNLKDCTYFNNMQHNIEDKELKYLFYKIIKLVKKISFGIFSDQYSYIKDDLLAIKEKLIYKCNKCSVEMSTFKNQHELYTDLFIINNLWLFFKNLNYSYYLDLNDKEEKASLNIKEYIRTEDISIKFLNSFLLNLKDKKISEEEKVYINFYLLVYDRFKFMFY